MRTDTYLLYNPNITIRHEINDAKMHRVIISERVYGKGSSLETGWHDYEQMIIIPDERIPDYRRTSICACTEHWTAWPRVFRITTAEKL